jgi:hypothetical protein
MAISASKPGGRPRKAHTPREVADEEFESVAQLVIRPQASRAGAFSKYQHDPVLYARERLGVTFQPQQSAVAYCVSGDFDRITNEMRDLAQLENEGQRKLAVTSGQKTGKTRLIVCLAMWLYECFDGSQSLLTAAIGDQIRAVVWRELTIVLHGAPHRTDAVPSEDPARGMVSPGRFSVIRGFTGRSIESVAGVSGELLYLVDEASHLPQAKAEVFDGNTAGGSSLAVDVMYFSQGTRSSGPFFDAFHTKKEFWTLAHFDSEQIAKHLSRTKLYVRGMATLAWVKSREEEYGRDSPFFIVRVLGGFVRNETGKIIQMATIDEAAARWASTPDDEGTLSIGFDPAGPGDGGDEHAFVPVRGRKCLGVHAKRGLSEESALAELYALLRVHRLPGEKPRIMIDAEGKIGSQFLGRLQAESERRLLGEDRDTHFDVYAVRTSSKYVREPTKFMRRRDEVWWSLAQWFAEGGAIPPGEHKLTAELYEPNWIGVAGGQIRATPKDEIRTSLGRSPDRADGLGLAVWTPLEARFDPDPEPALKAPPGGEEVGAIDVYDWERDYR